MDSPSSCWEKAFSVLGREDSSSRSRPKWGDPSAPRTDPERCLCQPGHLRLDHAPAGSQPACPDAVCGDPPGRRNAGTPLRLSQLCRLSLRQALGRTALEKIPPPPHPYEIS